MQAAVEEAAAREPQVVKPSAIEELKIDDIPILKEAPWLLGDSATAQEEGFSLLETLV